jgi:hypothetical protein
MGRADGVRCSRALPRLLARTVKSPPSHNTRIRLTHMQLNPLATSLVTHSSHTRHAQDWDSTTTEWFSTKEESDVPLPEYRLVFLWLEKSLGCAIDQV